MEKLSDLGEHQFISRFLLKNHDSKQIVQGIGDDCAVIDYSEKEYFLITTDMMVENIHFKLQWFNFNQIGMKLMEINVSDISAMGGKALYGFLSIAFPGNIASTDSRDFFDGLYSSANLHGVEILGGDTTEGEKITLNLTLIGKVDKQKLLLRSGCASGDLLCVTGTLGKSAAGLELCRAGIEGNKLGFLEPKARPFNEASLISGFATSMIDISDGLASEANHLAMASQKKIHIDKNKIPLSVSTISSADKLKKNPYIWALEGGEDFELLFTIPPPKLDELKSQFQDFTCIGRIHEGDSQVYLEENNQRQIISRGFQHFK